MAADRLGRRVAALGASALVLALFTGCTIDRDPDGDAEAATVSTGETTTSAPAATGAPIEVTLPGTLAADFQLWKAQFEGRAGLAVMPVAGARPVILGDWTGGPAWSTMKVPLVIAAERADASVSTYSMTMAITSSDNTAADALWQSLGGGKQAAQAIEEVLREAGDSTTAVPATRPRAEHSAFGQSEWSLDQQVRFTAQLPCLPGAETVLELMGRIIPDHQWGLGTVTGADFKGGWGPDASGNYLVRQLGIIDGPGGRIAVAVAAEPASGTFADGMNALNDLAALVADHLDELMGGRCPA